MAETANIPGYPEGACGNIKPDVLWYFVHRMAMKEPSNRSLRNGMLAGFFRLMPEVFMERHALVRQHLHNIEQVLRDHQLWQGCAPNAEAFESTQPFCLDTLQPHEWLQWVLIPRMHALIDAQHPLPADFAIAPYYEMALDAAHVGRDPLLKALQELDALFASDTN